MKTIHVIDTEDERKLVKDIFRKAIADKSNGLSERLRRVIVGPLAESKKEWLLKHYN